jgi:photosystem II stability/assembly factor-like uncharacterized protein
MKTFLRILFFFLLVTQMCFAQWYQQNSGTTANLNSVHFEDSNNGWAVGDSGIILHTTNGGQEWLTQTSGTINYLTEVWFTDLNIGWAVGDSGAILKTNNGGQEWIEQTSGTNLRLNSVCFIDTNNGWSVGYSISDDIILNTTNGGINWTQQMIDTTGLWYDVTFIDVNNGWAVGSKYNNPWEGVIVKTTNGGTTWIPPSTPVGVMPLRSVFFTDANNGFVAGGACWMDCWGGTILGTSDRGNEWSILVDSLDVRLSSISFSDSNNGMVVGGSPEGGVILRTTNAGVSWVLQYDGPPAGGRLYGVSFTDANNGTAVGDFGTILHTNNGGVVPIELTSFIAQAENQKVILKWTTATELNNNGFEIQRRVAESDFATVGFVRGEGTTTNQKEYSYIDKDLTDGKYFYRLKQIDYNGAYEYSNAIEVDVRSLNEYALEQNYPNPFNPVTTIGYVIKEKTTAKLILLNAICEEVAVLVNEEQDKGFHKIDFNASTLASGVYFYQLKAGDFVQTRKMILLK